MSAFHLRPVADHGSPSPSSTTPIHPTTLRRPLSPSSLRELNLTQDSSSASRKYPAPPTGHELMALFPAPRPADLPELRQGSTSGFFQRQERAFFAQAGRDVFRSRLDIDAPDAEPHPKSSTVPRTWPQLPPHPQHPSPTGDSPYMRTKQSRSMPGPLPTSAPPTTASAAANMYPVSSPSSSSSHTMHNGTAPPPPPPPLVPVSSSSPPTHHHHHHPPPPPPHDSPHGLRTPPHDHHHPQPAASKMEFALHDDMGGSGGGGAGGPDESWRPHDRRRAGKHTKRVMRI
ncbi:hypothetical protein SCLCIDRAFT_454015 [Scleroderma citrinum Foug A]|uniref:Uncharacterized protein n=1 Tax=Scleroderma citrinum Foug A TaxID=1036808 RepID=A0A0C2ZKS5_9AGAM|nr:hypothetical protein SCLCIDRAFT_454015 [Scleroderma citrinum Foug A]